MSFNRDDIVKLLRDAHERNATEIHFKVPNRVLLRVDGVLLPHGQIPLTPALAHQAANSLCALANLELPLATMTDKEFSLGLGGTGRFQVALYRQRGSIGIIVQRSGLEIPRLDKLGFSTDVEALLQTRGLVLITGGHRRQGLMASLVDRYNASLRGYVVVIEDPLHYLHRDAMASIAQRGIGSDVPSLAHGLRTALRHAPDLVACGEINDRDTTDALLEVVEHDIPVLATISAASSADAIAALTRHYPSEDRGLIEARIRRYLRSVLSIPDAGPTSVGLPA